MSSEFPFWFLSRRANNILHSLSPVVIFLSPKGTEKKKKKLEGRDTPPVKAKLLDTYLVHVTHPQ